MVCIVTLDEDFLDVLTTELLPWCEVVSRDTYEDLARWTARRLLIWPPTMDFRCAPPATATEGRCYQAVAKE
jgi:hypothetical protein